MAERGAGPQAAAAGAWSGSKHPPQGARAPAGARWHTARRSQAIGRFGETTMSEKRPDGICITMRTLMIAPVIYGLALLIFLSPVVRTTGARGPAGFLLLGLLVAPWVLGMLVLIAVRSGPVKNWAVPVLLSITVPAMLLYHDAMMLLSSKSLFTLPMLMMTAVLNIGFLYWFAKFTAHMSPRVCPGCGKKTLIPLVHLSKKFKRLANTRWCGSCGSIYWSLGGGEWKPERRKTWLDETPDGASPGQEETGKAQPAHSGHGFPYPARHEAESPNTTNAPGEPRPKA
jgi:hypothetical protein